MPPALRVGPPARCEMTLVSGQRDSNPRPLTPRHRNQVRCRPSASGYRSTPTVRSVARTPNSRGFGWVATRVAAGHGSGKRPQDIGRSRTARIGGIGAARDPVRTPKHRLPARCLPPSSLDAQMQELAEIGIAIRHRSTGARCRHALNGRAGTTLVIGPAPDQAPGAGFSQEPAMDGLGELRPPEVQLSKPRPGTVNCALTPHKGFHHRRMWQIVTIDLWSQCVTTQRGPHSTNRPGRRSPSTTRVTSDGRCEVRVSPISTRLRDSPERQQAAMTAPCDRARRPELDRLRCRGWRRCE
jgi:hypothetical protein